MKKLLKIIVCFLISMILLFGLFIVVESIRLNNNIGAMPIIMIDQEKISLEAYDSGTVKKKYYGIGYSIEYEYYIVQEPNSDHKEINVIGADFKLFDLIRIWAWIS